MVAIDFSRAALVRHREYSDLDPTEQANISYWSGMMFATLVAERVLGVPRLTHMSAFTGPRLAKTNATRNTVPDLIGMDKAGNWHVLEAKARQGSVSAGDRAKWKDQAGAIRAIDGLPPATRSYCYTRVGQCYGVYLVDPEHHEGGVELTIAADNPETNSVVEAYYGPYRDMLAESHIAMRRNDRDLVVQLVAYDAVDHEYIFVGIERGTRAAVDGGRMPELITEFDGEDCFIGADGVVVLTSATPEP